MITQIFDALKEPFTALGRWVNPDRRREARKDQALEAAEHIIRILEKSGEYTHATEARLKKLRVHYQKRFDAWRNG